MRSAAGLSTARSVRSSRCKQQNATQHPVFTTASVCCSCVDGDDEIRPGHDRAAMNLLLLISSRVSCYADSALTSMVSPTLSVSRCWLILPPSGNFSC